MSFESSQAILLVDDDDMFRDSTERALSTVGYRCLVASDVRQAWELIQSESPSVVISDIRIDGNLDLEFVRGAARSPSEPSIILVTGYPTIETAVEAVGLRIAGYLVKPFEMTELVRLVDEGLSARSRSRSIQNVLAHVRKVEKDLERLSTPDLEPSTPPSMLRPTDASNPASGRPLAVQEQLDRLTRREKEIVACLEEGYRLSTIGSKLHISANTARRHLKNIFVKLEVRSQAALLEKLKPWDQ